MDPYSDEFRHLYSRYSENVLSPVLALARELDTIVELALKAHDVLGATFVLAKILYDALYPRHIATLSLPCPSMRIKVSDHLRDAVFPFTAVKLQHGTPVFPVRPPKLGDQILDSSWLLEVTQRREELGIDLSLPLDIRGNATNLLDSGLVDNYKDFLLRIRSRVLAVDPSSFPSRRITAYRRRTPLCSAEEYRRLLKQKNDMDPKRLYIGNSVEILRLFNTIHEANTKNNSTDYEKPILILGETGSGKSDLASVIHNSSDRAKHRFHRYSAVRSSGGEALSVLSRGEWIGYSANCGIADIPKEGTAGLLKDCEKGTIFVDEAHALRTELQQLLLDILDRKPIRPVGQGDEYQPNVRLIFATNEDINRWVKEGQFRIDLLRRINSYEIRVPKLQDRGDDIFVLVRSWMPGFDIDLSVYWLFLQHDWPGNVGELKEQVDKAKRQLGTRKKWTLEDFDPPECLEGLVRQIRAMSDVEVEQKVLEYLRSILERQGFKWGEGLVGRMANVLGKTVPTMSRMLSRPQSTR